jgi:hypothetical protein
VSEPTIGLGDLIKDRDIPYFGIVIGETTASRHRWPFWVVREPGGQTGYIGKADALLVWTKAELESTEPAVGRYGLAAKRNAVAELVAVLEAVVTAARSEVANA